MTLDGTIEIISNSTEVFSAGNVISIIVAIISFLGVYYSAKSTNETTTKINVENKEFQELMTQKI